MIYLASPYSHPEALVMNERFRAAAAATAHWICEGHAIYSPIVHCHELARRFQMPTDFSFWTDYNLAMLNRALELWVLKLPGWERSQGIAGEMTFAEIQGIRTSLVDPPSTLY